jgi:monoamine oxidase
LSSLNIVIIGVGIAGFCATVCVRECGYQVMVFEKNERSDAR